MWIIEKLFGSGETESSVDDENEDLACNVAGHEWEQKHSPSYYAHGVPGFGPGNKFKVEKKTMYECVKCGNLNQEKEVIGRIAVDLDTDELTVIQ